MGFPGPKGANVSHNLPFCFFPHGVTSLPAPWRKERLLNSYPWTVMSGSPGALGSLGLCVLQECM